MFFDSCVCAYILVLLARSLNKSSVKNRLKIWYGSITLIWGGSWSLGGCCLLVCIGVKWTLFALGICFKIAIALAFFPTDIDWELEPGGLISVLWFEGADAILFDVFVWLQIEDIDCKRGSGLEKFCWFCYTASIAALANKRPWFNLSGPLRSGPANQRLYLYENCTNIPKRHS